MSFFLAPNSTVSTRVTRTSTIRKSQLKPTFNESEGKLYKINKTRAYLLGIRHGKLSLQKQVEAIIRSSQSKNCKPRKIINELTNCDTMHVLSFSESEVNIMFLTWRHEHWLPKKEKRSNLLRKGIANYGRRLYKKRAKQKSNKKRTTSTVITTS